MNSINTFTQWLQDFATQYLNISAIAVWFDTIMSAPDPLTALKERIGESLGTIDVQPGDILLWFFESPFFKIIFAIIALRILLSYALHHRRSRTTNYTPRWNEIRIMGTSSDPYVWQLALIRADQLLEEILYQQGYKEESMQDRLMSAAKKHGIMNELIPSHRLRNSLVHESGIELNQAQLQSHLLLYEKAFHYFKCI